jgi:hypothetical protein
MSWAGMLLSAILISSIFIPAHAIDTTGTADRSILGPNMNMPEPLVSGPNMDMPAPNPKPLVEPNKNPGPSPNQTINITSNQTKEEKPLDLSGKWSMKLDAVGERSLDLSLFSLAGVRFNGFGSFMEKGLRDSVTADGSLAGEQLSLVVKSATSRYIDGRYDECDLELFFINNTLSGTYALKSSGQSPERGEVTAVRQ